ncbi:MAG TPA: hypothetical protein VIU42_17860 [Xanthobacteraceae bacterium]|jgi:hypothetical protein
MTSGARPFGEFVACLSGPLIWAAHFFVVYGAESVVCIGATSPAGAMRLTVFAATAIALVAMAAPYVRPVRGGRSGAPEAQRFLSSVARWLAILSAAAIIAVAAAAVRLTACASPAG